MRNQSSSIEEGGATTPTIPTNIVGPCGRFTVPLEPSITLAFHRAAKILGAEASQLLAEAVHTRILAAIETAQRHTAGRARK